MKTTLKRALEQKETILAALQFLFIQAPFSTT